MSDALTKAILDGDISKVQRLIDEGLDVTNPSPYGNRETPLYVATSTENVPMVELLLKKGANVNGRNKETLDTPLHAAAGHYHIPVAKVLLENGADINAKDSLGATPLKMAVTRGSVSFVRFLLDKGVDINVQNIYNHTPLHVSLIWKFPDIAKLLIERGADVNAKNNMDQTPLHLASGRGMTDIVNLLLQKGADIEARDNQGNTPIRYAKDSKTEKILKNALARKTAREAGRALTARLPNVIRGLKAEEQQLPYGQVRVREGKYDQGLPPGIPERITRFIAAPPRGGRKTRRHSRRRK